MPAYLLTTWHTSMLSTTNPAYTWSAAVNKLADKTTEEISRLKVHCCLLRNVSFVVHSLILASGLPPWHVPISALSP